MSQADVGILFELQVARDRFKADLDAMKADFDQWRQQATGVAIEIPVRLRDEASGQLAVLLQSLQAQANVGISIPVSVGGGGGGGGAVPYLPGGGIGPAPGRIGGFIHPSIGSTPVPVFATPGGIPPGIGSESFGGYDTPYGGGFGGVGASAAAAGGGLRGIRLMGAAYLAVHGVRSLAEAAAAEYDQDNPIYNPYASPIQGLRSQERLLEGRATGVTGFANRALSFLGLGFSAREDLDAVRAQEADSEAHQRNIQRVQRMQATLREEGFTDRFGRATGLVSYTAREQANSAAGALAGAGAGEFGRADASIDAEHDNQMEAIRKRIQHLREQGVSEQTLTQEMNSLANSAGIQAQAAHQRVNEQRTLFNNQTLVLGARASGDFLGAVNLERTAAESALRIQFGDTPLTQRRIDATRAENSRGDANRAWDMMAESAQSAFAFDGDTYNAARIGIMANRTRALEQDPLNTTAIIGAAAEQFRQARMTEANRLDTIADQVTEMGIDNPYEQARRTAQNTARRTAQLQPERAGEANLVANATINRINREEDRQTRSNNEQATVMRVASGDPVIGGEWLPMRSRFRHVGGPNPEEARALDLQFNLQRQLREHTGDNPHDIQLRESIKAVGAEQARQLLAHTSDPRARTRLEGLIRRNYSAGTSDPTDDDGNTAAGSKELADAAAALRAVADTLKGAKTLYVVK